MKKKKLIWQIPFLLILIIGSIFVIRQQRNTPFQKDEGMVFGTIYHITYQSDTNYQKEIEAELQKVESPFNLKRYNNPQLDAQLNYLEAKNSILTKKLSSVKTDKSVFKGKPPDAPPTGTSVSTRTTTAVSDLPPLDEVSQDFIKRTGMSVESVAKALKSEMPYHLRGMR